VPSSVPLYIQREDPILVKMHAHETGYYSAQTFEREKEEALLGVSRGLSSM
jgi:hypothetical protein